MLDLQLPWAPVWKPVGNANVAPIWQSLSHVLRNSMPYSLDPTRRLLSPPEDASHTTQRVAIPLGDTLMPGWLFEPREASGASVCIAHGTSAEGAMPYYLWIRAMLGAGIRVLLCELDGHGENPRPLSCPGIDENMPAAIAFLRQHPGVDPHRIGLLGVSLGGACVVNAAACDPGIKAVVTVAAPHRLAADEWQKAAEFFGLFNPEVLPVLTEATPDHLLSFLTAPMRVAASLNGPVETMTFLEERTGSAINRTLRYLNPLDNAARLRATPLLVINGEWDNVAPPWQALDLYARAAGPKALAMVPRRNHLTVMISRHAVDAMMHWFRRWL